MSSNFGKKKRLRSSSREVINRSHHQKRIRRKHKLNLPLSQRIHCNFYLDKKRRYCSMGRSPGSLFCGVHKPTAVIDKNADLGESRKVRERINCPHDPSHTIWKHKLRKHEKVCPAVLRLQKLQSQPYYSLNLNSGTVKAEVISESLVEGEQRNDVSCLKVSETKLKSVLNPDEFEDFWQRIDSIYSQHFDNSIFQKVLYPEIFKKKNSTFDSKLDVTSKDNYMKHLIQQASIVGHMQRKGLIPLVNSVDCGNSKKNFVYVEWGAGRGGLSLAVQKASPSNAKFVLVERARVRFKADGKILKYKNNEQHNSIIQDKIGVESEGSSLSRCTIDIRHLDLAQLLVGNSVPICKCDNTDLSKTILNSSIQMIDDKEKVHVVGMSKHLCGVATDLTLRCMKNSTLGKTNGTQNKNTTVQNISNLLGTESSTKTKCEHLGVAIALCCHHRCVWNDYVGREYFRNTLGLGELDFMAIRRASSWCTPQDVDAKKYNMKWGKNGKCGAFTDADRKKRIATGRKCKRILDLGRITTLGLSCELVKYVDESLTPENVLLIAWREG